jgi:hypothetical protein
MDQEAHLDNLKGQHADLEREINDETRRPLPDNLIIQALKRRKLRLKEELVRIVGT